MPHSRVLYYQSFNVTFLDCLTSIFHSSRRHQFFCLSVGLICNAPITLPTYCGILDSHMTSNCCLLRVLINIRLRVPLAAELSIHRCLAVVKANRVVLPTKLWPGVTQVMTCPMLTRSTPSKCWDQQMLVAGYESFPSHLTYGGCNKRKQRRNIKIKFNIHRYKDRILIFIWIFPCLGLHSLPIPGQHLDRKYNACGSGTGVGSDDEIRVSMAGNWHRY